MKLIDADTLYKTFWQQYITMKDVARGRKNAGDLEWSIQADKIAETWKRAAEIVKQAPEVKESE